jgi:hypothetical protein
MSEKLCHKCNRLLPRDAFPTDGFSPCRECRAFQQAAWFIRNKKQIRAKRREYAREYRKRNPGYSSRKTPPKYNPEVARRAKQKYLSKPGKKEQMNARSREYYWTHRAEILAQKKRKSLRRVL